MAHLVSRAALPASSSVPGEPSGRWAAAAAMVGAAAHLAMVPGGGWMAVLAVGMAAACLPCAWHLWRGPSVRAARTVLAVLDAEGVESAHAVGYSLGSRVAFSLAATVPDRIRSLTALGGTYRPQRGEVSRVFFPGYLEALDSGRIAAFVEGFAVSGRALDPATRHAFLANDPAALAACFRATEEDPGLPEAVVAQLTLPALLMAGTRDPQRLADSRRASELMPQARFVELPGRTHAATLAPAGPILDHLVPFLRGAA